MLIGLDTNVIVRYLAQDDAVQSLKATQLIETLTQEDLGFITMVSIVELMWVMQGCYKATKVECVAILNTLLRTQTIIIENADIVIKALNIYSKSNADFADCLIERCASQAKCERVMTFDINAAKTTNMLLIK